MSETDRCTDTETPRIFGIGLCRTGTTSLTEALQILGYRAIHFPRTTVRPCRIAIDPELLRTYHAFTDMPVPLLYRCLDRRYPRSRFVLTVRDPESWIESFRRLARFQKGHKVRPSLRVLRHLILGRSYFHESAYRRAYGRHLRRVRRYFASRPQDLLILNIAAGDGWEKLCPFLGRPIPEVPFPHSNKGPAPSQEAEEHS